MKLWPAFKGLLNRKKYLFLIALLTLAIVHLRTPDNFPFQQDYSFPLRDFLVHFLGTWMLWEIQFWNFRHYYDKKLYEQGFSLKLVGKVLGVNLFISFLFYIIFAPSVIVWVYEAPISLYGLVIGLLLSLLIAFLINVVYLGLQLYRYWQSREQLTGKQEMAEPASAPHAHPDHLLIRTGKEELQLPLQEIAYFYTEQKVVFAVTVTGQRFITQYNLAELEVLLPYDNFFKINRQIIVNRQAVRSVKKAANYKLLLQLAELPGQPQREETISRYKAAEFRDWFREDFHQSV